MREILVKSSREGSHICVQLLQWNHEGHLLQNTEDKNEIPSHPTML